MTYHFTFTSTKGTADACLLMPTSVSISTYCTTAEITISLERQAVILTCETAKTCSLGSVKWGLWNLPETKVILDKN